MKIHRSNHYQRSNWRFHWLKKPLQSGQYRHWLVDGSSLTARLQQRYAEFSVEPALEVYAKPFFDEAMPLKITPCKTVLIREVLLIGNNQPVVFAHSVLPRKSLRGSWLGLSRLGSQPLGAVLFANPRVKRTPLAYKKLSCQHALYQQAAKDLANKPAYLWARRSMFSLNCANIMVTEVFLPQLLISSADNITF